MDITDYIPNIFGAAAPTSYEGLQTMGLISPQQAAQQQKTANIQGLLGAGLALAQGMSRTGPRRSAAENILGALSGGFGAAGGAYQQGLQNVVQQQQLQSAALTQAQATNRLRAIQQASKDNPQLAQLFAINPEEASKQLLAIERAKMYGFGTEPAQDMSQIPAQMPAQAAPQPELPLSLAVTSKGTQFVGVPNFAAGERYVDANLNQQAQQTLQPRPTQAVPMVDQANVAKANENRRKAALALSLGDKDTAGFFEREAERLDPKETLFFRDGRLISSKRGELANYGGGRILTDAEATSFGLDPTRGKWTMKDNIPSLVQGTSTAKQLTSEEAKARGLDPARGTWLIKPDGTPDLIQGTGTTRQLNENEAVKLGLNTGLGQRYQIKPDGTVDLIQGSGALTTKQLTANQSKDLGLDTSRGQVYQQRSDGNLEVVQGTMQDVPKYTGMYANVALEEFQTADVTKLTADQRKKVGQIAEARTGTAAEKGAPKVYTGALSKTTAGDVEKSVITTADAVTRLNNIQFSYRPEYQTIQYRGKQAWGTLKDKYVGLPEKEKRQLAEYSQYRQNSLQNLNQTIKDITGAAMGVQEAERIIATLPNAGTGIFDGDSPTEFEAKLNNAIQQTKYALARKQYSLRKGLNWESTPLEKIPLIVQARGKAIAEQYNLDPNKTADLQTINRQLAAEFGVSF
jgi:hypothetical protein